jgi:hypothetical protein
MKTSDYDSFDSNCSQTMVGFWQTKEQDPKISCVIGSRIQKDSSLVYDHVNSNTQQ